MKKNWCIFRSAQLQSDRVFRLISRRWRWWNPLSRWRFTSNLSPSEKYTQSLKGFHENKQRKPPWSVISAITSQEVHLVQYEFYICPSSVECNIIKYWSLYVQSVVYLFSDPVIPFSLWRHLPTAPLTDGSSLTCWLMFLSPQAKRMCKMFSIMVINMYSSFFFFKLYERAEKKKPKNAQ